MAFQRREAFAVVKLCAVIRDVRFGCARGLARRIADARHERLVDADHVAAANAPHRLKPSW
jgi:hypothetical protein